jgi:hypothetical protein
MGEQDRCGDGYMILMHFHNNGVDYACYQGGK